MNIQLLQGEFSGQDSLELINKIINVKINHHENRITKESSEEEIKYREIKIKKLQNELHEIRNFIIKQKQNVKLESNIKIN